MRIPPSMIVMGLLTVIPFGIAIKQTLGRGAVDERDLAEELDPSLRYERESQAQHLEWEKQRAAEEAAEAAKKLETRANQRTLFGKTPASLGSVFEGLDLGAPKDVVDNSFAKLDALTADFAKIEPVTDLKALVGFRVKIGGYHHECQDFGSDLSEAWGSTVFGTSEHKIWVVHNPGDARRAVWDEAQCTLTIERFADVEKWLGHGEALVPLDYVGKPAKALIAKLGPSADSDETTVAWQQLGVGTGTGITSLTAEVEGGKITSITARVQVDQLTRNDIVDRLTKLYGAVTEFPASGADLAWTKHPHVELSTIGLSLELRATK